MPCDDITEYLQLELDPEDRIRSFSLQKNTCGAAVGDELLLPFVRGVPVEQVLHEDLLGLVPDLSRLRLNSFLLTKQLAALKLALAAYVGRGPAGRDDAFAVERIEHDAEGTKVSGLVRIEAATEAIAPCGSCATCGSAG